MVVLGLGIGLDIWNLNHEFRPELNLIREMATKLDG